VYAGVRPPGDRELTPRRKDAVERGAQFPFDRAQAGLRRPAVKPGAVVLEGELEARG
jgi:hypothetical protein